MAEQESDYVKADKREQNSRKALVFIIITILLGVNGLLLWQFFDKKSHLEEVSRTLENTSAERDALSAELQRVKAEFEKVNQENSSLQSQLLNKDEEIKSKMAQIRRMIESGDGQQLAVAREELQRLKIMNQSYVLQLDSLRSTNTALASQNESLNSMIAVERNKASVLAQENTMLNKKVAAASVLKTTSIKAMGIKYKTNGREIETNKAASTQKIKTCFTILENTVTNAGSKDVYLRVLSPDGAVMSNSSETFSVAGQASLYTTKESFDYDNREMNLCIYWEKGVQYSPGKYTIEVYCEGSLIASTLTELK
jgi:predicted nuclease with TOPRIM domain